MQRHTKTTMILAALAAVVLTLQTAGTAKTVADAIAEIETQMKTEKKP